MITLNNPLLVLVGLPLMAYTCWGLSHWWPLLVTEERAHASSLALDGLRGILACSVFFHHSYVTYIYMHTGMWTEPTSNFYAQLGPTAVVLFFFISGYLFWKKMLKNPNSIRAGILWPNRLRRIIPAYWAAIALALLAAAIATGFRPQQPIPKLAYKTIEWICVGFPCLPDMNGILQERITGGVFWTLRAELLFYLILPILVWFRKGWKLFLLLAIAALVNRVSHRFHPTEHLIDCAVDNLQRFTLALATCFSIGMFAAYRPFSSQIKALLISRWSAVAGLLLLAIQMFYIHAGYTWYEPILLAPIFFMVIEGNSFFGLLTSRPMRCAGQTSYSIYIFHGLILFVLSSLWNRYHPIAQMSPVTYWGFILSISIFVACFCTFTYLYIERPFLSRASDKSAQ